MRIKYFTTRQIIADWGNIEVYAAKKKLSPQSVRKRISTLQNNKIVEKQIRKDGYGELLDKDDKLKIKELKKNGRGK